MSVLKIGIVEDELVIARTIINVLIELGYAYCGPAINFTEAIQMQEEHKPDLVLLDIQLAGKKDGIDVAQQLNEKHQVPFIFLTANSDGETIERAKKVNPDAYIVKPFNKEELFAAIEIAFSNFTQKRAVKAAPTGASRDFIFVRDGYVFRKVFFHDLLYLESDGNYVALHLKSQKKIMVRSTLDDFAAQLAGKEFVRVHRSYSVNVNLIDDVFPGELSIAGTKIPVSKSYRDDLLKLLGIS